MGSCILSYGSQTNHTKNDDSNWQNWKSVRDSIAKRNWKNYKKIPWKILKIRLQQNVQILGKSKIINSKTNSSRNKKAE